MDMAVAQTADFLSPEAIDRALKDRVDPLFLRARLGLEKDYAARHADPEAMNVLLIWLLRLSRTDGRGRANAARIVVRHNEVRSARLPAEYDGYTILHLTDLHADMSAAAMRAVAARVAELEYDLCVLTGDYRGRTSGPFQPALRNMLPIRKALRGPVYGVLGNHDPIEIVPDLERLGIRMLLNEHVAIERQGARIHLAGIDDPYYFRLDSIEKAAGGIDPEGFSVLLSHAPDSYQRAAHANFDLLLAGHTHGGQICLPGGRPVIVKTAAPRTMVAGAWAYRDMAGYTSVGAGACGVPVRFNCPPEITLHRLRRPPPAR